MCASWALSLTLRGSGIFQADNLSIPSLPPEDEGSVWDALQGNSFADRLLEALEAFHRYYSNARYASPPRRIYSQVLDCQRQLLAHAKTLNLSDDVTLQHSTHPTTFFQTMHRILNHTILEVCQIRKDSLQPPIDDTTFQGCLHLLVDYLRDVLLTPGAQWPGVEHESLRITALLGRELHPRSRQLELVEAILYRGFVHQSLYAGLKAGPIKDERRLRLSRDRRIGPILISALGLYLGLYPSTTHADIWSIFCRYLLFLSTGHLQKGVHFMCAIDLIPSTTAVLPRTADPGIQVPPAVRTTPGVVAADTEISPSEVTTERVVALLTEDLPSAAAAVEAVRRLMTTPPPPTITAGLDFLRRLPRISLSPFYDGIDDDDSRVKEKVERTVVDVCRGWNLENHTMMGSCMVWLAESFRHGEEWAMKVDGKGVIQLFVTIMRKRRLVQGIAQLTSWNNKKPKQDADPELWSSVDVVAAGALFLRAWKVDFDTVEKALAAGSTARVTDWPGWTDTATIEAFATWLPTLESNGKIIIKEKDDDITMAMVQTTIEVSLVTSFLDQASEKNPAAVKSFGLDSILQKTKDDMKEKKRNIDFQKQERLKWEQERERREQERLEQELVRKLEQLERAQKSKWSRLNNWGVEIMASIRGMTVMGGDIESQTKNSLPPAPPGSREMAPPLPSSTFPDDFVSTPVPTIYSALHLSVLTPWEAIRSGVSCCLVSKAECERLLDSSKVNGEAEAWLDTFLGTLSNEHALPRPTSTQVVDTEWISFTWGSPDDLYAFYNAWLHSCSVQDRSRGVVPYMGSESAPSSAPGEASES
ncbi:hypothetical protein FRB97_002070 [Tulasnella sp. 331]|nr:hypothetical protein FRB97_002070 [Tulasnella sp. 331]